MITSKFSKNNHMCILLLLLTVHIIKGTIVHSTEGDGYIDDDSFILKFDITPSFTGTAIIAQDGTTRTTCFPSACSPTDHNDVSFNQSGTEIILTFSPVSISHQGSWQCSNNGEVSTYPFAPQQRPRLISTMHTSEMTAEIVSSFLEVTRTIEISDVLLTFESTEVMTKPSTSLITNTLSLEDSLSTFFISILPFSTYKSFGPIEQQTTDFMTTGIDVQSTSTTSFFFTTSSVTDETINSGLSNGDIFPSMVTSTRNNLPISSEFGFNNTTDISLHDGLTQSHDLYSATNENILITTHMLYTSIFSSVFKNTKTTDGQTSPFSGILPASFDAQTLNSISLQSSLSSLFSLFGQDVSVDTLSLSIEPSLENSILPVDSSSTLQIYSSAHSLLVSRTESLLVNTSIVSPLTSSSIVQNVLSVGSFSPVETFSISIFVSSSRSQSVNTLVDQIMSLSYLSSISSVWHSDVSGSHVVLSSDSSPISSFISSLDIFTFERTDQYAYESITSMVSQSLQLSSSNPDTYTSDMLSYSHLFKLTSTSLTYQAELFPTSSVNQFTQSDSLTLSFVNPSAIQSSYYFDARDGLYSDSFETSMNADTSTFLQTMQPLHFSTYSRKHDVDSSFISTVVRNISASLDTSFTILVDTSPLSNYYQVTDPSFRTSVTAKVVRSTTSHDFSSLSSLIALNVSDIYSTQLFESSYVLSSQPTFPPSQAPELSFLEAQITIVLCSIAVVILVVFVSLMVMMYHRKLTRIKRQKEKYNNSEKDGLSSYGFPHSFNHSNKGTNIPIRYHNNCYSDFSYSCDYYVDFEKNWSSLRC